MTSREHGNVSLIVYLHDDLGSNYFLQQKILLDEWVDEPYHHGHRCWGFSKVLNQGLIIVVHKNPTQDAPVALELWPTSH